MINSCEQVLNTEGVHTMPTKKRTDFDFETALEKLNGIVEAMEDGDLSLEESLKQFEEGIKLTRNCQKALEEAEQKVKILVKQNNAEKLETYEDAAEE
jgi:exodeoxyribonuclease VII small subunit